MNHALIPSLSRIWLIQTYLDRSEAMAAWFYSRLWDVISASGAYKQWVIRQLCLKGRVVDAKSDMTIHGSQVTTFVHLYNLFLDNAKNRILTIYTFSCRT